MKLDLQKATDGTHFVIAVVSEMTGRQIVIPLSPELSGKIDQMVAAEGIPMRDVVVDPRLRHLRHSKLG